MTEQEIVMQTALTLSKNTCEILLHGAIEASTPKIKSAFMKALDEYLTIQGDIFKAMEQAGLYKVENITPAKINKVVSKYESTL